MFYIETCKISCKFFLKIQMSFYRLFYLPESECINNKEKDDSLPIDSKSLKHEILRNHHKVLNLKA